MADNSSRGVTRRDLLKSAGMVSAAAIAPAAAVSPDVHDAAAASTAAESAQRAATVARREPLEHLTAAEADMLDAIAARLIPSDASGPGAAEARAVHYIDRALGGGLSGSREAYRAGLAAFDRYCRMSRGAPFVELSPTDQDSVLIDVEAGSATGSGAGFTGSSAAFFAMVRSHTLQGTFGDPYYGGNANFVGWDLIKYPGVRTMLSVADQQKLERGALAPNHRSAYDFDGFNKASARFGSHEHDDHGDGSHGD